ncbi:MAG: transcriptional repressor [Planctomycetes bacterium]|nr:transcriptional repressor [Planctomycetota bacterium]
MISKRERSDESSRERLRAAGLNVTRARLAVLAELDGDLSHPTAEELFERLRRKRALHKSAAPAVSRATVYNCLEALVRIGYINILEGAGPGESAGARRFDPNRARHFHACCRVCGAIFDVEPNGLMRDASIRAPRTLPSGFQVASLDVRVAGVCAACARK